VDRADVHFQLLIFELPFAGLSADVGVARQEASRCIYSGSIETWLLIKKGDSFASPGWRIESALTPARLSALREEKPPCDAH